MGRACGPEPLRGGQSGTSRHILVSRPGAIMLRCENLQCSMALQIIAQLCCVAWPSAKKDSIEPPKHAASLV